VNPNSSKTVSTDYTWPVRGTTALPAQLRQTGQSVSYAAGDDGYVKAGIADPAARFTADATGRCLTDNLTGLLWARYPDTTFRTWQESLDYAASLNICGYTDWRLPNRLELRSLVDYGEPLAASYLNEQGFNGIKSRTYWTSTTYAPGTGTVWGIDFGSGADSNAFSKTTGRHSTMAVRSGTAPAPTGHALSGRVTSGGVGLAGVTVTLSGPLNQVTQTDGNGNYAFADLPDGGYTLTPARNHYTFTPTQLAAAISGADISGRDFTAALVSAYGWVDMPSPNASGLFSNIFVSGNEAWLLNNNAIYYSSNYPTVLFSSIYTPSSTLNAMTFIIQGANKYGWAVGNSSLGAMTTDGTTWSQMSLGGTSAYQCVSFPTTLLGFASGTDKRLHKTTNGGLNWSDAGVQLSVSNVNTIFFVDANTGYVGTSDPRLAKTINGGNTWEDDGDITDTITDIFFLDNSHGWAVGASDILRYDGSEWTQIDNPTGHSLYSVFFISATEGWACGNNGTIIHTTDGGATWQPQESGTTALLRDIFFTSPTNGYVVGNNGTILRYTTLPQPPTVTTAAVTGLTATTAAAGGNVTSDGEGAVSARGVCWGTSANPTIAGSHTTDGSGIGPFTSAITVLYPQTTYFVRAYATNAGGTGYGDDDYFTTPCPSEVARIGATGYDTLQGAIDSVDGAAEIRAVTKVLTEVLTISGNKTITLLGGYDCICTALTGMTTVHGSITVSGSAAVTMSNVVVQ
jgi:photosystem II stability/assembly factor-like uncharacterized protein